MPVVPVRRQDGGFPSHCGAAATVNGRAIAETLAKRVAVLQCAPRVRTKGRAMLAHLVKRFQKRRGHRAGGERLVIITGLPTANGKAIAA